MEQVDKRPYVLRQFRRWLAVLVVTQAVTLGVGWTGSSVVSSLLDAHHTVWATTVAVPTVALMLADICFLWLWIDRVDKGSGNK